MAMMIISQRPLRTAAFLGLGLVLGMCFSSLDALGQEFQLEPKPKNFIQLELGVPGKKKPAMSEVEVKLTPVKGTVSELKPGDEVRLSITIDVPPGSHTYSMTTPKGGKTRFEISKMTGLEPVGEEFQADREPESSFNGIFEGIVEEYHEPVTWTRSYRLVEGATTDDVAINGTVHAQICDENTCRVVPEPFHAALATNPADNAITHKERPKLLGKKPGPAELTATLAPKNARPGDKVTLTIEMALDESWHTYSITLKNVLGAKATDILIEKLTHLKPLGEGFTANPPFEVKVEDLGVVVEHEVHHGTIAWSREYEVMPAAASEGFGIKGALDYQTCRDGSCVPGAFSFDLRSPAMKTASRGAESPDVAAIFESKDVLPQDSREARLDVLLGKAQEGTVEGPPVTSEGLLLFIVTAIGAGFLALLTPCVYPMVPITISFFLKQAEKQHHRPVTLALVYCGGIIATFTGLGLLISGLFEATDLNLLANSVWLNIMLTVVIAFFGLSMLGLFEIHVPSWLLTWSARKEGSGGIVGTLFMALTFTLVSFTCTFAFAGALLVMASKGEVFWPVVGMLAFSAAFACPFFLLALFPQFLTKLPKSGGWLYIVRVSMGVLEIGAARKF
jgi:thiol:disulfide interchange protein DsbD